MGVSIAAPCKRPEESPARVSPSGLGKVRVLVVDDSVVIRRTLTKVLNEDPEIEVVGAAADGRIALDCLTQLTPDVVLLDIEMPNMNGFETLQALRKDRPSLPVIMFSSLTERGAAATLDALMLGANDYVPKPAQVNSFEVAQQCIREEVIPKIKQFARAVPSRCTPAVTLARDATSPRTTAREAKVEVVVIGVSTGGPAALALLLPTFVRECPVPIVIVQHMPPAVYAASCRTTGRPRAAAGPRRIRRPAAARRRSHDRPRRIPCRARTQRRPTAAAAQRGAS